MRQATNPTAQTTLLRKDKGHNERNRGISYRWASDLRLEALPHPSRPAQTGPLSKKSTRAQQQPPCPIMWYSSGKPTSSALPLRGKISPFVFDASWTTGKSQVSSILSLAALPLALSIPRASR
jgi:hypothetical protein